jgi:uncharacterized membrane protein YfcA
MIDLSWAASFLPLTGAGFGVGFLVGLTGVGGGALMTPLLISTFGVSPQVAVGTDLLYAAVTKTAGSWRHHVSDHVEWPIVFRLAAGSIPASIILLAAIAFIPLNTAALAHWIRLGLVVALPLSGLAIVLYPLLARRPERWRRSCSASLWGFSSPSPRSARAQLACPCSPRSIRCCRPSASSAATSPMRCRSRWSEGSVI